MNWERDTCLGGTYDPARGCVCSPGWQNDYAVMHSANCDLPSGTYAAFLGIDVVVVIMAFYIVLPLIFKQQNTMRYILVTYALTLTTNLCMVLSLYLQNGLYESGLIFTCLFTHSFLACTYFALGCTTSVTFWKNPVRSQRFMKWVKILFVLFAFCWDMLALVACFYCRQEPPVVFNYLMSAQNILIIPLFIIGPCVYYWAIARAIKEMNSTKHAAIQLRFKYMRLAVLFLFCASAPFAVMVVLRCVVGSVPGYGFAWMVGPVACGLMAPFVAKYATKPPVPLQDGRLSLRHSTN